MLLAIVVAILGAIGGYETSQRVKYPIAYGDLIAQYANDNNLDPHLVMAVIRVESNFVPEARSHVAYGLMQVTEETAAWTAKDMGITWDYNFKEPETNIMLGCYYLRHLIDMYGNIDTALAAYNAGMGNVNEWLANREYSSDGETLSYIPFPETRNYVEKVNTSWEYYKTTDFAELEIDDGKIQSE